MKTLEFIYQDTQIHFLLNPTDDNVMVNATEMAKIFNKRTSHYLANEKTKELIYKLELTEKSANSDVKILENRGHSGYYFNRILALDFATWLDVDFRIWVFKTIDQIMFGHLKEFRDLLQKEVELKNLQPKLKQNLQGNPCEETVEAYFLNQDLQKQIKSKKRKVVNAQLSLFEQALEAVN